MAESQRRERGRKLGDHGGKQDLDAGRDDKYQQGLLKQRSKKLKRNQCAQVEKY